MVKKKKRTIAFSTKRSCPEVENDAVWLRFGVGLGAGCEVGLWKGDPHARLALSINNPPAQPVSANAASLPSSFVLCRFYDNCNLTCNVGPFLLQIMSVISHP